MNERIRNWFRLFAENECKDSSPLYYALSLAIAEDEAMIDLASHAKAGQPLPNLFFASVQYLLAANPSHGLAAFYPAFGDEVRPPDHSFPAFKDFAQENRESVIELLQTRLVQTNEVRRCAYLYPALLFAGSHFDARPLAVVEIGTSAGLNLLWDQFAYFYDGPRAYGAVSSEVRITSSFRRTTPACLDLPTPSVASRIGIDLNVVDLSSEDQANWLRALVWPEHSDRRDLMDGAIAVRKNTPLDLRAGDGFSMLDQIADEVPSDSVLCVYHTHVANQVSEEARTDFLMAIDRLGARRDIVHIFNNIHPTLHFTSFRNGKRRDHPLARTDGHGRWIEWLHAEETNS